MAVRGSAWSEAACSGGARSEGARRRRTSARASASRSLCSAAGGCLLAACAGELPAAWGAPGTLPQLAILSLRGNRLNGGWRASRPALQCAPALRCAPLRCPAGLLACTACTPKGRRLRWKPTGAARAARPRLAGSLPASWGGASKFAQLTQL